MKKLFIFTLIILTTVSLQCVTYNKNKVQNSEIKKDIYKYPKFYKGVYIAISPKSSFKRFKYHIDKATKYGMNTVVLNSWTTKNMFTKKHFDYMKEKNIHAITRIVMFRDGLRSFKHLSYDHLGSRFELIEKACQIGFKEIQLDYIRFRDTRKKGDVEAKATFIEAVVKQAKAICKKYNVKLSVDVFGRIPFTKNDRIGQRMEGLDKVADVICPMAYPSYYGKKMRRSEYKLIKQVIVKSRERTNNAKVVLWIQGFKHKNLKHRSYYWFIHNQIKAVEKAGGDGFIVWNAGRNFSTVYAVMNRHFKNNLNKQYIAMR